MYEEYFSSLYVTFYYNTLQLIPCNSPAIQNPLYRKFPDFPSFGAFGIKTFKRFLQKVLPGMRNSFSHF